MNDFQEVDLKSDDDASTTPTRPSSQPPPPPPPSKKSRINRILSSTFRKSFPHKKRKHTTPVTESDLVKNSISLPSSVSTVPVDENNYNFSRSSILSCPFDISGYGRFLLMDEFKVRKPKKMMLMVFLFEKIIIFTQKQPGEESFYYCGSVMMDKVGIQPLGANNKVLEIKDFAATARFHKESIFSLEATSEYIQVNWRRTLERCLWSQLIKAKNLQSQSADA